MSCDPTHDPTDTVGAKLAPASVVVDMASLYQPGHDRGLGRYARGLRRVLSDLEGFDVVEYSGSGRTQVNRLSEWIAIPHRARFVAKRGGHYHATSPYNLDPVHLRTSAVTVQDLIPLDMATYRQTGLKAKVMYGWSARTAAVIVPSAYTAERLDARYGGAVQKIIVAALPPRFEGPVDRGTCTGCLPETFRKLSTYALAAVDIRTADSRKRAPWILGAAEHLSPHGIPLVAFGGGTEDLRINNLLGLGRICDWHMHQVMSGSRAFIYASAYEGQGLPPQEALLAGTPVVAFRNTSLPEMLGPGAIWLEERGVPWRDYVDAAPSDREAYDLAEAAVYLVNNVTEADQMAEQGAAHVGQFTQDRFRLAIQDLYQTLVES